MFLHELSCDEPSLDCPSGSAAPPPLEIEVTVPAGWSAMFDGLVIFPTSLGTEPPGGALALGWTGSSVGVNSDPCLQVAHEVPDIRVGPTVDEFVEAVVQHPEIDVSEPTDVELGGYSGRFLTLTGPSDISGCDNWRPWDPGFYVQGPDNLWDIWVIDVDGSRVLIVTEEFADTPENVKADLRDMVDSIRFVP
jgi:hypothetical protein